MFLKNSAIVFLVFLFFSCKKQEKVMFRVVDAQKSGIDFENQIQPTANLNIFNYMYYYNGGGVGTADLNNDGLPDLVFTSNLGKSKIFLNKGQLKFEDITESAGFNKGFGWANGVSMVDINQDGLMDIYISQVGDFETLKAHNLLYICTEIKNGIPKYEESAATFGLDLVGFGTQAAFVDFDTDGDLDFFQLNHSVHKNGTFGKRELYQGVYHPLAGDRYFKNENGKYIEQTKESGIYSNALGYGLGITAGDVNFDGYPDLYIGNDFHENDYLYINQKNGFFKDEIGNQIRHTSRFSMGVDMADLNHDVFPEIISLDMLPYNQQILKRSEGEDAYYNFKFKLKQGYNYQFARNNLQLNNGNNTFSEIGIFANIHATDWSWSALFVDFDNNGNKDLFISNGINKRMNDMDYINYVSDDDIQQKIADKNFNEQDESLIGLLPEVKIPNKFFRNNGDLTFAEVNMSIEGNTDSYSNGAVYVDLDNDGDQDIVTNNINDKAFLYENMSQVNEPENKSLTIQLIGDIKNKNAIGAKVLLFGKTGVQSFEKYPVRGFQSSAEVPLHIGLGKSPIVDSIYVIWPDRTFQKLNYDSTQKLLQVKYIKNLKLFDFEKYKSQRAKTFEVVNVAEQVGLGIAHVENGFNEFDREALIPNQIASEGPALAIADINKDGLQDMFLGSSRGNVAKVMLQNKNGKFTEMTQPALEQDKEYEEIDAVWTDINKDGHIDLVAASGGNEFFGKSDFLSPRIYLNNGTGLLRRKADVFKGIYINAATVIVLDHNKDGYPDLFFGARSVPFGYGKRPDSYLFINDKTGNFIDKTNELAPELKGLGMVKAALYDTFDAKIGPELIVALEWNEIIAFDRNFKKRYLTQVKGLWNTLYATDIDKDGDLDILAGNLGLNSRFKASTTEPLRMYVNDFDKNGRVEQIITYYIQVKETIFADKREIERQLPYIKKKFIRFKDFSEASITEIFEKNLIDEANVYEANFLENAVLLNQGNGSFTLMPFAKPLQIGPIQTAFEIEKTGQYFLNTNFFDCNIQLGQYDADFGAVYSFDKNLNPTKRLLTPIKINGQVRKVKPITINNVPTIVMAQNNDKLLVLQTKK